MFVNGFADVEKWECLHLLILNVQDFTHSLCFPGAESCVGCVYPRVCVRFGKKNVPHLFHILQQVCPCFRLPSWHILSSLVPGYKHSDSLRIHSSKVFLHYLDLICVQSTTCAVCVKVTKQTANIKCIFICKIKCLNVIFLTKNNYVLQPQRHQEKKVI